MNDISFMERHQKRTPLYEGTSKILYESSDPSQLIQHFKDELSDGKGNVTVFNGKGSLNCRISEYLMNVLEAIHVPTHLIETINMREQLVHHLEMIPIKVIVRNIAKGNIATRLGIEEGVVLSRSVVEFVLKNDNATDSLVNNDHIHVLGILDEEEIAEITAMAQRVNDVLTGIFTAVNIRLVDFKLEFGRMYDEWFERLLMIGDELSPDTMRLWDMKTNEVLDKERAGEDDVEIGYHEVARRLGLLKE